jgi:hypothetical protein
MKGLKIFSILIFFISLNSSLLYAQSPTEEIFLEQFKEYTKTFGNPYLKKFLVNIRTILENSENQQLFSKELNLLNNQFKNFHYKTEVLNTNENNSVKLKWDYFYLTHKKYPHFVIIGVFTNTKEEWLGYFIKTIYDFPVKSPELKSYFNFIETNQEKSEVKGITKYFVKFFEQVFKEINVKVEKINASWIGRLVWAQNNYQFDPNKTFTEDGKVFPQWEQVQRNFIRFLAYKKIDPEELIQVSPLHPPRKFKITELLTPQDFLFIISEKGKKIPIRPMIAHKKFGEKTYLNIGRAFMLYGDNVKQGQTIEIYITDDTGNKYSDRAMPSWFGVHCL